MPVFEPSPLASVFNPYVALHATIPLDPEFGLGGKLLCSGDLRNSHPLLFAANIAGAASIAASADPVAQRQAIRDGVVDFVVTSLEEALRILKNEVRKRQAVSVGVGVTPETLIEQMLDHGVLPELLAPAVSAQAAQFLSQGARPLATTPGDSSFLAWSVDHESARWLPKLDALAQQIVPASDVVRQRWLRLAPRYLGRLAHKQHGVALSPQEAAEFRDRAAALAHQADQSIDIQITG